MEVSSLIPSHPPPHAGCPRGDPGPLWVLTPAPLSRSLPLAVLERLLTSPPTHNLSHHEHSSQILDSSSACCAGWHHYMEASINRANAFANANDRGRAADIRH